jgi:hypothetical protein
MALTDEEATNHRVSSIIEMLNDDDRGEELYWYLDNYRGPYAVEYVLRALLDKRCKANCTTALADLLKGKK